MSGAFIHFARAHGVEIEPSRLHPSERIKRTGTVDKPRSTNGAYFWDGERGWVFNWAEGARVEWFEDPHAKPWTEADKAAWKAKRDAARVTQEQEQQRAARRADDALRACTMGQSNYLTLKGFPDEKAFLDASGSTLIPMNDFFTGNLSGVQRIYWNHEVLKYEKKMTPGMKAKGAVYRLGSPRAALTVMCEGYATGLSIKAAIDGFNASVLVCFSASNLVHLAKYIRGRVVVFADNDASGTGQRAAEATGLPWCMSPTEGQDANDLHKEGSVFAVRRVMAPILHNPAIRMGMRKVA